MTVCRHLNTVVAILLSSLNSTAFAELLTRLIKLQVPLSAL